MYIGIDIGTTSTKAILFDDQGKDHGKSVVDYPINSPEARHREQDPNLIFQGVLDVLGELGQLSRSMGREIKFISFSTMMHSLIAVDKDGKPLTNCIIWADSRSIDYVEEFKSNGKGLEIYKRTGTPCHPMSPLYKIMWIRDNQPEVFSRSHKFISIKEYVFYKLFGEYLIDHSMASATGMFDIHEFKWDEEALSLAGIREDKLSKAIPTTSIVRGLREEYRQILNFEKDIPFIIGATDGCLANLGSNGIDQGTAVVTIGTSGAVRVVSDRPLIDEAGRNFSYVLTEDKFVSGGPINNGGIVYRWFRDNFADEELREAEKLGVDPYDLINKMVESVEAGSDGLLFHPFLTGERAPYWNANLRAAYLGISDSHERKHFARALIEGISFAIKDVYLVLVDLIGEVDAIYVNGGFTRSEEWIRILSSIMDMDLIVAENYESPSLGAVMLGRLAMNEVEDLSNLSYMLEDGKTYSPADEREVYDRLFKIYQKSIKDLMETSEALSRIQEED